jgi:hypothetical protein
MATLLTIIGGMVVLGGMMFLSAMFNGYALSVLWGWFIVPTFNLPPLSVAPAIGVAMVVSYLTHQVNDCEKNEQGFLEGIGKGLFMAIAKPLFALFFGSIVRQFM